MARLIEIDWPDYGAAARPELAVEELRGRLARTRAAMEAAGWTHLVVYGDREHFANLTWLTNFDPRFEEGLLVVGREGAPLLLTGNECMSYLRISPLYGSGELRAERFQPFSLPDQPRDSSRELEEILAGEGIGAGARVGCAGWKEYGDPGRMDAPAWIVDVLRGMAGEVRNAAGMLIGLRSTCSAYEIAFFEYTNSRAAAAVRRMLFGMREGMTDHEVVALGGYDGLPLSTHMSCKTGPRRVSLASASGARVERGYPWSANVAFWGANICRAGWVAESEADLPEGARDYAEAFAGPYVDAMGDWLAALRIGVTGGELHALVQERLPFASYGVFLNAGHLIHLDEWLASPVYAGSTEQVRTGMVFQTDIIPSNPVYFSSRMEDGVAVADAGLRAELAGRYPEAWARMGARRRFATEILGFRLGEELLPLSDTFGLVPPYVLNPRRVFALP
jgi:Xaa-Pro aminopeptidase